MHWGAAGRGDRYRDKLISTTAIMDNGALTHLGFRLPTGVFSWLDISFGYENTYFCVFWGFQFVFSLKIFQL